LVAQADKVKAAKSSAIDIAMVEVLDMMFSRASVDKVLGGILPQSFGQSKH
jgi:hypothetical protein